jgi:hypothetical protein
LAALIRPETESLMDLAGCLFVRVAFADDDPWILAPGDHALVMSKRGRTRLGFAILLAFFRDRGRFPRHESEVDPQGIATLSQQLNVRAPVDGEAFLVGRTAERMRSEIRVRFGFREATVADAAALSEWLRDHAAAEAGGEIEAITLTTFNTKKNVPKTI